MFSSPLQRSLAALLLTVALAGCATRSPRPRVAEAGGPVADAAAQPLRDLSLVREEPAPILLAALAAPYAVPEPRSCVSLSSEVSELDLALGRDLDDPAFAETDPGLAEDLAASAMKDLVGLPYRGVIRRVTGAYERDRRRQRAILAGFVRRAYLKGLAASLGCGPAMVATPR